MLPALSLGAELVGRGHQVRALGDPTIEPSARAAGCAFSPWREAPHFNSVAEQTAMIAAARGRNPVPGIPGRQGLRRQGNDEPVRP